MFDLIVPLPTHEVMITLELWMIDKPDMLVGMETTSSQVDYVNPLTAEVMPMDQERARLFKLVDDGKVIGVRKMEEFEDIKVAVEDLNRKHEMVIEAAKGDRLWKMTDGNYLVLENGWTVQSLKTEINANKIMDRAFVKVDAGHRRYDWDKDEVEEAPKGNETRERYKFNWEHPAAIAFAIKFVGFAEHPEPGRFDKHEFYRRAGEFRQHVKDNLDRVRLDFYKHDVLGDFVQSWIEGKKDGRIKIEPKDEGLYRTWMNLATRVVGIGEDGKFVFWGNEKGMGEQTLYEEVREKLAGVGVDVEWLDRIRSSYLRVSGSGNAERVEMYDGNGAKNVLKI